MICLIILGCFRWPHAFQIPGNVGLLHLPDLFTNAWTWNKIGISWSTVLCNETYTVGEVVAGHCDSHLHKKI